MPFGDDLSAEQDPRIGLLKFAQDRASIAGVAVETEYTARQLCLQALRASSVPRY